MASSSQVILSSSIDWLQWFQLIETSAVNADIWEYVDPSIKKDIIPTCTEPEEPTYRTVNPTATTFRDLESLEREELRDLRSSFKRKYTIYREQKVALSNLVKRIQETVDHKHHYLLRGIHTPHGMLIALKDRLSPTEKDRERDLVEAFNKLKKMPRNSDIDDWLAEWQSTYTQCKALDLPEVHKNRASVTFLNALRDVDALFADAELREIQKLEEDDKEGPDVIKFLNRYETRRRMFPPQNGRTQPTFVTFQGKSPPGNKENKNSNPGFVTRDSFQQKKNFEQRKPPALCLCGKDHFFGSCPYLVEVIRPAGWKPNPQTARQINNTLKEDAKIRATVERAKEKALKRHAYAESKTPKTPDSLASPLTDLAIANDSSVIRPTSEPHRPDSVMCNFYHVGDAHSASSEVIYELRNSILLDSASTIHVSNDFNRFTDYFEAITNDYLIAGNTTIPVLGYGTTMVYATTPDNKGIHKIALTNTAFVPSFHTSLISLRRAMQKGFDWHIRSGTITHNGVLICKVFDKFDQWVVEYNPIDKSNFMIVSKTFATVKKSSKPLTSAATKDIWHRRLGHVSMEAVEHISDSLTGAKIIPQKEPLKDISSPCENCTVANLQHQISRRPMVRATKPFERVHFDLIQLNRAFNGDEWALHFLCDKTRVNLGFTFPKKTYARQAIKDLVAFVKRQNQIILIWHTDGEKTLEDSDFAAWLRTEGFVYETIAPYTSEQNGPAERSGGVIFRKARAMRIEAQMPENLWPEFFKAAIYITNRTPTKQLGWLTPLEKLYNDLDRPNPRPSIAHLRIIGCRAYTKINNIPKKSKMAPRALIGYLVGYDSTNIFRVWVPQKRKVIRSRDVIFDEDKRYDPNQPYLEELLHVSVPGKRVILDIPDFRTRNEAIPFGVDELEDDHLDDDDDEEDTDVQDSNLQSADNPSVEKPSESTPVRQLPTPSSSSRQTSRIPESPYDPHQDMFYESDNDENRRPTREIIGNVDERNILTGPRHRNRRRATYIADLQVLDDFPGFYSAFTTGAMLQNPCLTDKPHRDRLPAEPKSWREMQRHPLKERFTAAANREISELLGKQTFKYVERPKNTQILPVTWVFRYKFDTDGFLTKFKARLCARGDLQRLSLEDTYAATLAAKVFRTVMAIAATFDLETNQYDVKNAFPHTDLDEIVYCECPEGFEMDSQCILLLKALYGLRRAPRLWQKKLVSKLTEIGLRQISEEPCLFINDFIFLMFFSDDIATLFHGDSRSKANTFKKSLLESFDIEDLGELKWFIGVRVIRDRPQGKLWLCQDSYIEKITNRFNLQTLKPPRTPMVTKPFQTNSDVATPKDIHLFQQKVGSLLYATTITRPDAARAANKLSEFMKNPSKKHLDAVDRAIQYLHATKHLAIQFSRDSQTFLVASDAAFADNFDRKSTEGYLFMLFGGPIDWRTTKQKTVTTSTTEAELLALSHTTKDYYWWTRLFTDIGLDLDNARDTPILCDNKQTVSILKREQPTLKTQLKHVDIINHWLRQEFQANRIRIQWVPTSEMPADGFTKPLPRQRHEEFIRFLNLTNIYSLLQKPDA